MIMGVPMDCSYPLYYEDAAHIAHFLTRHGLRLKDRPRTHLLLMFLSCELEIYARYTPPSHSVAGRTVVAILSDTPMDESQRRRLHAIAGTLVGNFLTSHQISQSGHK